MPRSLLLLLALVTVGCLRVDAPSELASSVAPAGDRAHTISDGAHNGNVRFHWLPPLVPSPNVTGEFDDAVSPRVWISAGPTGPTIAEFTTTTGTGSELLRLVPDGPHYQVNWHTDGFELSAGLTYRIHVGVGETELGYADVDVAASGRELKNVDTQQFIALLEGRTLPIKFRIEKGAIIPPDPEPTTVSWINPNGGDWNDPDNWSTGAIPTTNQDVFVDLAVAAPVVFSGTHSVRSLSGSQPIDLNEGALIAAGSVVIAVPGNLTINAEVVSTAGNVTLTSAGTMTLARNVVATAGTATFTAAAYAQAGGTIRATTLALSSASGANLTNLEVTNLQATNVGPETLRFETAGSINVGPMIQSTEARITVRAGGSINVIGNLVTPLALDLFAGASVSQTAGTIATRLLFAQAASGISLTQGSAQEIVMTNSTSGDITIRFTGPLSTGFSGVTNHAPGGDVDMRTTGSLSVNRVTHGAGGRTSLSGSTISNSDQSALRADELHLSSVNGATLLFGVRRLSAVNSGAGDLVLATGCESEFECGPIGNVEIVGDGIVNTGGHVSLFAGEELRLSASVTSAHTLSVTAGDVLFINAGHSITAASGMVSADILWNGGTLDLGETGNATAEFLNNLATGVLRVRAGTADRFTRFTGIHHAEPIGTLDVVAAAGIPAGSRLRFLTTPDRYGLFSTTVLPAGWTLDASNPTYLELVAP